MTSLSPGRGQTSLIKGQTSLIFGQTSASALSKGRGGFPAYIYNLKAANTAKMKTAMQAVQAGTRNAFVSGLGHSVMAGQSAEGTNLMAMKGPIPRLAVKLNLANLAAGANNVFGYHNGFAQAAGGTGLQSQINADGRLAIAGTMAIQGIEGPGGLAHGATSITGTMDITFTDEITEYDIYSTQNSGHATYFHSVDGGAATNVDTNAASAFKKVSVSGLAKASHVIRHGWVSGTTRILGVEARDGTRKEISCRNQGISGIQSASLLTDSQTYTRRSADKALVPDLSFIMCMINDVRASTAIATTKANIKAKAQDMLISGDCVLVMEHYVNDSSGNMALWLDYRAALYEIADELDIPLIDFGMKWGSFATANAAGKMSDTLHPSFAGYDDMATTYAALVRWVLSGSYSETF